MGFWSTSRGMLPHLRAEEGKATSLMVLWSVT